MGNYNTIIEPFGPLPWTVIDNLEENVRFMYGNANQAIASKHTTGLLYANSSPNTIVSVNQVTDANSQSVDSSRIEIGPPPTPFYTVTMGDVNNDGTFGGADVVFLSSYIADIDSI